jgi:hypothetical protein
MRTLKQRRSYLPKVTQWAEIEFELRPLRKSMFLKYPYYK